MAKFQVVLSEEESNDILIETIRKKFSISTKTRLELSVNDDSGVTIQTSDELLEATSWLEDI